MFKDRLCCYLHDRHPKTLFRMFLYSCGTALQQIERFQENAVKKQMASSKKAACLIHMLTSTNRNFLEFS